MALIERHYAKADGGRMPYPLETMLRVHLLQNWFSLSDPAMKEALYEITSMRKFARLTLSAPIPEDTTSLPGQAQHQRLKLLYIEFNFMASMRGRPMEFTLVNAARGQPDTRAVVHQYFHPIGAAIG